MLTLLISRGVPMLLGGDEFCRTQQGNNNAYCQDNEINWYNWNYVKEHQEIYRFTKEMIAFRKAHPVLSKEQFYTDHEINWFNSQGILPNWNDPKVKNLACLIDENEQNMLYLMFNAASDATDFVLPSLPKKLAWHLAVDTASIPSQAGFLLGEDSVLENQETYLLESYASAILMTHLVKQI